MKISTKLLAGVAVIVASLLLTLPSHAAQSSEDNTTQLETNMPATLSSESSFEYDLSIHYSRISQTLFDKYSFQMDAVILGGTVWWGDHFGIRVLAGRSTETVNSLQTSGKVYTNRINSLFSGILVYRHDIGKATLEVGIGKTDYKSTWWVDGVVPAWGDNGSDSDWSYHVGLTYPLTNKWDLSVGYVDMYRKDKPGYGREETRRYDLGVVYNF